MTDMLLFITGASRGIGRAMAAAVPAGDARVVDISRSGPPPDSGMAHVAADLADPSTWAEVGRAVADEVAAFDGERITFVHAAGTLTPMGFAGEVDDDTYRTNVLLNSAAGQVLGHHFLKAVHDRTGRRELLFISSGAAHSVYPGWTGYGAGKAALDQWVRDAGAEQEHRGGTRVLSIGPGVVATAMQAEIRQMDPEDFPQVEKFIALHEQGKLRDPDAVASEFWAALDRDLPNGTVTDLREL